MSKLARAKAARVAAETEHGKTSHAATAARRTLRHVRDAKRRAK